MRGDIVPSLEIDYASGHQSKISNTQPENILLTNQNRAKLCDFGFAAILGERKTLCGTYEYMSP
jgi:serine/threonine protein kinase